MIRRPPRSTLSSSSAASDVYKRQVVSRSERESSGSPIRTTPPHRLHEMPVPSGPSLEPEDLRRLLDRPPVPPTASGAGAQVYGQRYLNLISKSMNIPGSSSQPSSALSTPRATQQPISPRAMYAEAAAAAIDPRASQHAQQSAQAALAYLNSRSTDGYFYSGAPASPGDVYGGTTHEYHAR
eukprot:TRINITY_DN49330_c0_g1_i1.p1 TRINITY_DN49330_c0_g1~~TRINITY_DN49330_c0_g1_i1.p1  ORF type:complete len:182 (-),score=20.37 TRINITY_DN49330_c0_g1_i1:332-877(-)